MEKAKKILYITDITLHTKDFRPTLSMAKAEEKTCMGFPSPRSYGSLQKVEGTVIGNNPDGTFRFILNLPPDVVEGVNKGEIELRSIHEGGIRIYAGDDVLDKVKQMEKKQRRQVIHTGRVWRAP